MTDQVGREQARAGQVQGTDEKGDSCADAREEVDRQVSPSPPDGDVGEEDQGQRQQDLCRRRYRVEEKVSAQPSPGFSGMSSRGRISSIGKGSRMVVFFSEPISTIVWRKRS